MRFVVGMIVGAAAAMVLLLLPEARESVLDQSLISLQSALPAAEVLEVDAEVAGAAPEEEESLTFSEVSEPALQSRYQVAWSSFHSESSASGFADKMTRLLERDFGVVRAGPGQYEVRFLYASEADRRDVLQSIASLTGFSPIERDRDHLL